MNCSYRILKNVHIGVRVRKTSDKNTVPFVNEPMTGMKIERWDNQGFHLSHPNIPTKDNSIWLDFNQLPLNQLNIEMGVIKNPLTFVEQLVGRSSTTSMILMRADTFDYLELLDDKKQKDEAPKYNYTQLKPGDQMISCLCREGNVMIYLGKFIAAQGEKYRSWYSNQNDARFKAGYVSAMPDRLYFAYPQHDGTYSIVGYPTTNKTVVEMYKAEDKGKKVEDNGKFNNIDENLKMIMYAIHGKRSDVGIEPVELIRGGGHSTYYMSEYPSLKDKTSTALEAIDFWKKIRAINHGFTNKKEYQDYISALNSRRY